MINLSTPNKEMLAELKSDYSKANYWIEKKTGGGKKVEELKMKLMRDYYRTGKTQVSEPIEYISPNANRWLFFFRTQKVGDYIVPMSVGFCYYETYGSIGAFMLTGSKSVVEKDGVTIFPSHFFQRLDEKLGLGIRSREVVMRFMEMIDNMVIQYKGDSDKRRDEVEVSFFDSVWRGRLREGDRHFIELSTFIPHKNLSSRKQLEKARKLQEVQKSHVPNTRETDLEQLEHGDAEAWVSRLLDNVNGGTIQNHVTKSYFYLYNLTELVGEQVGIKVDAETFDGLLEAEARGEHRMGMIKTIYQLSYDLLDDDEFGAKVHAFIFLVLRKFGYTGSSDDLLRHHEAAVKKYLEWLDKRKESFNRQFKRNHGVRKEGRK